MPGPKLPAPLNADDARALTKSALRASLIADYIPRVEDKIRQASSQGKRSVINPFSFQDVFSQDRDDALHLYFTGQGFKIVKHPDPDPGHPCSAPYVELSW